MTRDPQQLWLVRHGQSLGNVAHETAARTRSHVLDIAERDMDVPLSDLGRRQARAFGRWLASEVDPRDVPEVVVTSPYQRAVETARLALDAAELDLRIHREERLREREFGVLDLLTREGIAAGSGDVLAGLVVGAVARSGDAAQAACWATWARAAVGQLLGRRDASAGFLARELLDAVPSVLPAEPPAEPPAPPAAPRR